MSYSTFNNEYDGPKYDSSKYDIDPEYERDLIKITLTPAQEANLGTHPAADLFPRLAAEAAEFFKQDLKNYGLRKSIVVVQNEEGNYDILDGRNREKYCKELGIECRYAVYSGTDPLGYVISENARRRDLTEIQRADIAWKLANATRGGDRKSSKFKGTFVPLITLEDSASRAGVQLHIVKRVKKIRRSGIKELNVALDKGIVKIDAAGWLLKAEPDELREALAKEDKSIIKKLVKKIKQTKRQERRQQESDQSDKDSGNNPAPDANNEDSNKTPDAEAGHTDLNPAKPANENKTPPKPEAAKSESVPNVQNTKNGQNAEKILANAIPDVRKAVEDGTMSLHAASKITSLSPESQKAELAVFLEQKKQKESEPLGRAVERKPIDKSIQAGEFDGRALMKVVVEMNSWPAKIRSKMSVIELSANKVMTLEEAATVGPLYDTLYNVFKEAMESCDRARETVFKKRAEHDAGGNADASLLPAVRSDVNKAIRAGEYDSRALMKIAKQMASWLEDEPSRKEPTRAELIVKSADKVMTLDDEAMMMLLYDQLHEKFTADTAACEAARSKVAKMREEHDAAG